MIDYWRIHNFIGLLILTTACCSLMLKRWGLAVTLAFWWTLISALLNFANPWADFPSIQFRLDTTSAYAFVIAVVSVSFVANISRSGLNAFFALFEIGVFLNCLLLLYRGFGVFNAYSMDNAVSIMAMPLMLWRTPHYFAVRRTTNRLALVWYFSKLSLPALCLCLYGGSTALFAVAAAIVGHVVYSRNYKILLTLFVLIPFAFLIDKNSGGLSNPGGRISEWNRLISWWWEHGSILAGTGSGTFEWIAPMLQVEQKAIEIYLFMHSEYLQALFEQGVIGVILYSWVGYKAFRGSLRAAPWVTPTLFAIGVLALTMYPLRFMMSLIFVLAVIREALECSQQKSL